MNTLTQIPSDGLSSFEFQYYPLRMIADEHGKPWFIAVDVCAILGYDNQSKAIKDHCKETGLTTRFIPALSNRYRLIDEENLFLLIANSGRLGDEVFGAWVRDEVLPSLRLPTDSLQVKPVVILHDGKAVTTSTEVARYFGKLHKHVLDKIRELLGELPAEFNEPNFRPVDFFDAKGEKRQAYELTRDAFMLLVMGFTGKTALAFKLAYIQAFNRMEMELLDTRRPLPQDPAPVLPPPAKEPGVTRLLVTMREGQQPTTETLSPNKHVLSLNDFTELARKTGFLVISKEELNRLFGSGHEI